MDYDDHIGFIVMAIAFSVIVGSVLTALVWAAVKDGQAAPRRLRRGGR